MVFGHPWIGGLFDDPETAEHLSPESQLNAMIRVEQAYASALGKAGVIDPTAASQAAEAIGAAQIDVEDLRIGTARDGLPVPALVAQLREALPAELHVALHKGLTSQDVIDTALVLALSPICDVLEERLTALSRALEALSSRHGAKELMGRTRMQAALPITLADRVETWQLPLQRHADRLAEIKGRLVVLQFGGAVGTRHVLGDKADAVASAFAAELRLETRQKADHAMRDTFAEFASWLSLVSGSLGKMGQDITLMAQQGIDEITLAGGGSSSAMPHKSNPILAELLVTLARYNATQLGGMHQAMIHEQERSGAAWALEWMILPSMILATGRALSAGSDLIQSIERIGA